MGIIALERLRLDEVNVGLGGIAGIARAGIDAHQVARRHLVIFQRNDVLAVGRLGSFLTQHGNCFFGPAVDGVVQADVVQSEVVFGAYSHGNFFDGIHLSVPAGAIDLDAGRRILAGFDEEILAHADVFALLDGRDVIHAILLDGQMARQPIPCSGLKRNLRVVAQHQDALGQRTVRQNRDLGVGAFHSAQIAARIFDGVLHSRPSRVMIGDADLLNGRKIDDAQIEMLGLHRAGLDVIFDIFRQAAEQELIGGSAGRWPHFHRLPL